MLPTTSCTEVAMRTIEEHITGSSDAIVVSRQEAITVSTMRTCQSKHVIFGQIQSWIPLEIWKDFHKTKIFNKTKVLQSLQGQLSVIHVLILNLKTNNDEAFFISSGASFHILGPKLVIVSVLKYAVCIFLFIRCVPLLRL